jgi:hypothetical protein
MYWLLLPVEANAQRHLADETEPSSPTWSAMGGAEPCQNSVIPARTPRVHDEAIQSLAAETQLPNEVVRRVFESEFVRLKDGARVKDFLVLFAMRRTRGALRSLPRVVIDNQHLRSDA